LTDVRKPSVNHQRDRRLVGDEETAFLKPRATHALLAPLIIVLAETAMRRGESAQLTVTTSTFLKASSRYPATKNGTAREVPLSFRAIEAFKEFPTRLKGS